MYGQSRWGFGAGYKEDSGSIAIRKLGDSSSFCLFM